MCRRNTSPEHVAESCRRHTSCSENHYWVYSSNWWAMWACDCYHATPILRNQHSRSFQLLCSASCMAFIVIVLEDKRRSCSSIHQLQTLLYSKTDPSSSMEPEEDSAPVQPTWAGSYSEPKSHEYPAFLIHPCYKHFTHLESQIIIEGENVDFKTARNRIRAEMKFENDPNKDKKWDDIKASEFLTRWRPI